MSLSNKCIPPLGSPSTLNVGILGVGIGNPELLGFRPVTENVVLSGVPMDASEPSGLDIERFRCLRLRDDLFFLIPITAVFVFFGEPGTRPESLMAAWLSAGVAGETVAIVSAGL
jgi:hypothetical protein